MLILAFFFFFAVYSYIVYPLGLDLFTEFGASISIFLSDGWLIVFVDKTLTLWLGSKNSY